MSKIAKMLVLALALCLVAGTTAMAEPANPDKCSPAVEGFYLGQSYKDVQKNCESLGLKLQFETLNENFIRFIARTSVGADKFLIYFDKDVSDPTAQVNKLGLSGHFFDYEHKSRMTRNSLDYYVFISNFRQIANCHTYELKEGDKFGNFCTYTINIEADWVLTVAFKENGELSYVVMDRLSSLYAGNWLQDFHVTQHPGRN